MPEKSREKVLYVNSSVILMLKIFIFNDYLLVFIKLRCKMQIFVKNCQKQHHTSIFEYFVFAWLVLIYGIRWVMPVENDFNSFSEEVRKRRILQFIGLPTTKWVKQSNKSFFSTFKLILLKSPPYLFDFIIYHIHNVNSYLVPQCQLLF